MKRKDLSRFTDAEKRLIFNRLNSIPSSDDFWSNRAFFTKDVFYSMSRLGADYDEFWREAETLGDAALFCMAEARFHPTIHQIHIVRTHPKAIVPEYSSLGAACFDLFACLDEDVCISPFNPVTIGTGLAFEVPPDSVMLIFSRSGHGFTYGITLANCTGVIDPDYRGEVKIKLSKAPRNNGHDAPLTISHGDRIAQALIIKNNPVKFSVVGALSETHRGNGGVGSTGGGGRVAE